MDENVFEKNYLGLYSKEDNGWGEHWAKKTYGSDSLLSHFKWKECVKNKSREIDEHASLFAEVPSVVDNASLFELPDGNFV